MDDLIPVYRYVGDPVLRGILMYLSGQLSDKEFMDLLFYYLPMPAKRIFCEFLCISVVKKGFYTVSPLLGGIGHFVKLVPPVSLILKRLYDKFCERRSMKRIFHFSD